MLTVVGLGNPGTRYRDTRHNVGFMLADGIVSGKFLAFEHAHMVKKGALRKIFGAKPAFKKASPLYSNVEGEIGVTRFQLVKPMTFMNESGRAMASMQAKGAFRSLDELLVVYDDVDLEVGRVRLRSRGSAGGHNGMKSIIGQLGTEEFARLRIGVGPRPDGSDLVDYVLGTFTPAERDPLANSLDIASRVVGAWITGGLETAYDVLS